MRNKFKISVCAFLMVCVCFASNVVNANAENKAREILNDEYIKNQSEETGTVVIDGVPCVKDEIVLFTNVFYNPVDYTSGEGVEFLGVRIVKTEALFPCDTEEELKAYTEKAGNLYSYVIMIDGSKTVQDSINVLAENETVLSADPNAIVWLDELELGEFTANDFSAKDELISTYCISKRFVITAEKSLISTAWE